jgi:hypothetical protein
MELPPCTSTVLFYLSATNFCFPSPLQLLIPPPWRWDSIKRHEWRKKVTWSIHVALPLRHPLLIYIHSYNEEKDVFPRSLCSWVFSNHTVLCATYFRISQYFEWHLTVFRVRHSYCVVEEISVETPVMFIRISHVIDTRGIFVIIARSIYWYTSMNISGISPLLYLPLVVLELELFLYTDHTTRYIPKLQQPVVSRTRVSLLFHWPKFVSLYTSSLVVLDRPWLLNLKR